MSEQTVIERLCQLSHATSLQQICDLTFEILGNPIFISDMAHTILAYTKTVEINDAAWQNNVVLAHLDRNTISQAREVSTVHESSAETRMPVVVTDGQVPYPRIIKALVSEGRPVGVMVLTAYIHPLGPDDVELIELISAFVVPQLVKERYHISANEKTVENYFIKLLDGAQYSRERVCKRLDILGYNCRPSTYVLSVCLSEQAQRQENEDLHSILEEFRQLPYCRTFLYNAALVCVYGSDVDISDWEEQAPQLTQLLRRWELVAGVSRRVSGLERLKEYHIQAQETLAVGRRLKRKFRYSTYDSLSSFLLFQRVPEDELGLYCHQKIQELGEYDRTHNTELCATLQVYLEQTKSLVRTAEILFVHRNTVRYRINKCMELLGSSLEDGNEIFSYILSLRMLEYEAKLLHG